MRLTLNALFMLYVITFIAVVPSEIFCICRVIKVRYEVCRPTKVQSIAERTETGK